MALSKKISELSFQLIELLSEFFVLLNVICARVKAFLRLFMVVFFWVRGVWEDASLGHITAHHWV